METNELGFLKLQSDNYMEDFQRIATELFCNYCIRANEKDFDIIEVEFYYDSNDDGHPDNFIYDKTERNNNIGNWFFHYSGIDLTFGNNGSRGGILIRAIKDGSQFIIGPLRTMMALLNEFPSLTSGKAFCLKLEPKHPSEIYPLDDPLKRKGLDKTKSLEFPIEADRKYRFTYNRNAVKLTDNQFEQYYGKKRSDQ